VHSGGGLGDDDRGDDPVDHHAERRPPSRVGDEVASVLPVGDRRRAAAGGNAAGLLVAGQRNCLSMGARIAGDEADGAVFALWLIASRPAVARRCSVRASALLSTAMTFGRPSATAKPM
jgi:hypothetical protein